MNKIIYFAYGANLDLRGMNFRCPGYIKIVRAMLHDYLLVFRGVADIEAAQGETVHGALYQLTQRHLAALDRFEGYPTLYTRKLVEVVTPEEQAYQAIVYQMTSRQGYSRPSPGYLRTILDGYRDWNIPEEQIEALTQRAARPY
jgi:gamma-glutamylcyclotransferase (GGCT)/AIG2-like uncharacterized protein YtfP